MDETTHLNTLLDVFKTGEKGHLAMVHEPSDAESAVGLVTLEDIIEEIMTQGTAFGKEIDPSNPWNMTGKEFDASKSGVLAAIMTDMREFLEEHGRPA